MTEFLLTRSTLLARPRARVFDFFADPGNLQALTPGWLRFEILTPQPIVMERGARIDYRIALRGLPMRWQSEITVWEPPGRFVDEQRRGPYRRWVHEHLFVPRGEQTEVIDRVRYSVFGGRIVDRLFVAGDLARIFDYRTTRMRELIGGDGEDLDVPGDR